MRGVPFGPRGAEAPLSLARASLGRHGRCPRLPEDPLEASSVPSSRTLWGWGLLDRPCLRGLVFTATSRTGTDGSPQSQNPVYISKWKGFVSTCFSLLLADFGRNEFDVPPPEKQDSRLSQVF